MKAGIFTYAWDLDAEGHDLALGRIAETGFTAVNLACAYHAGKFLLPHNPRHRVYFPEDGAVYFRPDDSLYGRIQPRVSSLVTGDDDPLTALDHERGSYGLELVAWTVCLHNSWLGERYPDCTMHTAFGDPLIHSLSPAHPDVREYMRALVTNIVSQADVAAIQLESPDYMGFEHGYHHEIIPVAMNDPGIQRHLLNISFNPVEIEQAGREGIDAERLRAQVVDALDAAWNFPDRGGNLIDAVNQNPDFDAYVQFLTSMEARLISEIRAAVKQAGPRTEVRLFASMGASADPAPMPSHLVQLADGMMSGYVASDQAVHTRAAQLREMMGGRPVYGMVRAISPDASTPEETARRVMAWRESGVDGIDVYNYGFMPLPMFDAVRHALQEPV